MAVSSGYRFSSSVSIAELGIRVDDPIQHLHHCHQKIERSLEIVQDAVNSLRSTAPALRAEAAAALDYELALLQLLGNLHTQDEEQSLFPRLVANLKKEDPYDLRALLPVLELQHREKEALLEKLAGRLTSLSLTPGPLADEQLAQLEALVGALAHLYRPHITIEEERLLPNCRTFLTPSDLDAMHQEMRLRFQQ